MSMDSRQKRAAVIGTARAWYRNPHPSSVDEAQRASIGQVYPVASFAALSPPVFSGTIPTITGDEGDADIITDLSGYFSGATSYSIAPSVEVGWDFDTVTGILTVDTDVADTFGTYVVTGTNGAGSDDSNAFSVVISASTDQPSGGFFFDYDRLQYKRKKERKRLDDLEEEAERIKNKLDKELALEFRKKEREESRVKELQVLTRLAKDHKAEVERVFNEKVIKAANRAIIQGNYSAMESLERQIKQVREEEEFLLEAARIYFNA